MIHAIAWGIFSAGLAYMGLILFILVVAGFTYIGSIVNRFLDNLLVSRVIRIIGFIEATVACVILVWITAASLGYIRY